MWSPGYCPFCCDGSCSCKGVVQDGVVDSVAGKDTVVRGQYSKLELGRQDRAGQSVWLVLPIPNDDIGVGGVGEQSQKVGQDVRVDLTLKGLSCAEIDANDQNGGLCCLPQETLIAASRVGVGFKGC